MIKVWKYAINTTWTNTHVLQGEIPIQWWLKHVSHVAKQHCPKNHAEHADGKG
jgi:hypothetical protein